MASMAPSVMRPALAAVMRMTPPVLAESGPAPAEPGPLAAVSSPMTAVVVMAITGPRISAMTSMSPSKMGVSRMAPAMPMMAAMTAPSGLELASHAASHAAAPGPAVSAITVTGLALLMPRAAGLIVAARAALGALGPLIFTSFGKLFRTEIFRARFLRTRRL